MVGQPAAGVTSDWVGAGVGVGAGAAGGLLMMMSPLVPGDTISSAPQPAKAMMLQLITKVR
jgi:hypothetical protein